MRALTLALTLGCSGKLADGGDEVDTRAQRRDASTPLCTPYTIPRDAGVACAPECPLRASHFRQDYYLCTGRCTTAADCPAGYSCEDAVMCSPRCELYADCPLPMECRKYNVGQAGQCF